MYDKIKLIKMFLATILMTITLISIMKSCANAFTTEEFWQQMEMIKARLQDEDIQAHVTRILNQRERIQEEILDVADPGYITYIIRYSNTAGSQAQIQQQRSSTDLLLKQSTFDISSQSSSGITTTTQWFKRYTINDQGIQVDDYISLTEIKPYWFGLISLTNTNTILTTGYFQNVYRQVIGIEHPNNPNDPLPILIAQAVIGSNMQVENVNFKLYDQNENEISFSYIRYENLLNYGMHSIDLFLNSEVPNNQLYKIKMYHNDTWIWETEYFRIRYGTNETSNTGQITNASGDVTRKYRLKRYRTRNCKHCKRRTKYIKRNRKRREKSRRTSNILGKSI